MNQKLKAKEPDRLSGLPGQVVLEMQGGGALGAFGAGVYAAMDEAGIMPDWVVGTSIGAINGAIIAGNAPADRMARLQAFWRKVSSGVAADTGPGLSGFGKLAHTLSAVTQGIPGFFSPNPAVWLGADVPLGATGAAYYSTAPLRDTLEALIDFDRIAANVTRLTLGAVNVQTGRMRYFDSRDEVLGVDHVLASGALPPAFPAVMIDGVAYWDGGICSNTPIEVVLDDKPRRDSLIFAAQLWQQRAEVPATLRSVLNRQKDIQYASRADSHVARQSQIHHLRHLVRELGRLLPDEVRRRPEVREMLGWGCGTVMHVLNLAAPPLAGEDATKDIDFTEAGIGERWRAGFEITRERIRQAPWTAPVPPSAGVVLHD